MNNSGGPHRLYFRWCKLNLGHFSVLAKDVILCRKGKHDIQIYRKLYFSSKLDFLRDREAEGEIFEYRTY